MLCGQVSRSQIKGNNFHYTRFCQNVKITDYNDAETLRSVGVSLKICYFFFFFPSKTSLLFKREEANIADIYDSGENERQLLFLLR